MPGPDSHESGYTSVCYGDKFQITADPDLAPPVRFGIVVIIALSSGAARRRPGFEEQTAALFPRD